MCFTCTYICKIQIFVCSHTRISTHGCIVNIQLEKRINSSLHLKEVYKGHQLSDNIQIDINIWNWNWLLIKYSFYKCLKKIQDFHHTWCLSIAKRNCCIQSISTIHTICVIIMISIIWAHLWAWYLNMVKWYFISLQENLKIPSRRKTAKCFQ